MLKIISTFLWGLVATVGFTLFMFDVGFISTDGYGVMICSAVCSIATGFRLVYDIEETFK